MDCEDRMKRSRSYFKWILRKNIPGFLGIAGLIVISSMIIGNRGVVLEKMGELYEKYGIMFEVSIKHNLIFIRFFTGHLFENKRLSMLNKKQLYREYIIFKSILQIINKIDEIF